MQVDRNYTLSGIAIFFAIFLGLLGGDLMDFICYPIRLILGIGTLLVAFAFGISLLYMGNKQKKRQTESKVSEQNTISNSDNSSLLISLVGTGILLLGVLIGIQLRKKNKTKDE
jgi:hypothetical protein